MRTSVPGPSEPAAGFTLVELLVVVLLIGIATVAGMTMLRPMAGDLARESGRTARLLELLALEARLSGRPAGLRCEGPRTLALEVLAEKAGGGSAWQPWGTRPQVDLPDPLSFGRLLADGVEIDCGIRVVLPVFGLGPAFSLHIVDASGSRQDLSGDGLGRVAARADDVVPGG